MLELELEGISKTSLVCTLGPIFDVSRSSHGLRVRGCGSGTFHILDFFPNLPDTMYFSKSSTSSGFTAVLSGRDRMKWAFSDLLKTVHVLKAKSRYSGVTVMSRDKSKTRNGYVWLKSLICLVICLEVPGPLRCQWGMLDYKVNIPNEDYLVMAGRQDEDRGEQTFDNLSSLQYCG